MGNQESMLKNREALIGKVFTTNWYGKVRIVKYYNRNHVLVEFQRTGALCSTRLNNLRKGALKDPFAESKIKLIRGKGYIGIGKFQKASLEESYDFWHNMLNRCYNPKMRVNTESYKSCSVCEEWHNFQNFSEWFYRQIREPNYSLDKDILVKNNRVYRPNCCAMVPPEINILFAKRKNHRGSCPIGVFYAKNCTRNPFSARCSDGTGRSIYLGSFSSQEDAFVAYKTYKESLIRKKAEEYKSRIDPRIYKAMMNYLVEITD